jgi:phosphoglycolate phosphatase
VRETLTELRRRHCRLAVVTNKPAVVTHRVLRDVGLSDLVEVVIGGDTLPQRKPHPAPLREAARQLALDIADLVMVGDNIHDIEAAHAAGILSIAVTYGYHHRPPGTFGADCLVDRLDQLLSLIRVSTPQSDRPSISLHPACSAPESLQ